MRQLQNPIFEVEISSHFARLVLREECLCNQAIFYPLCATVLKWCHIAHALTHEILDRFDDGSEVCPFCIGKYSCKGCVIYPIGHMNCHDNHPYIAFKAAHTQEAMLTAAIAEIAFISQLCVDRATFDAFGAHLEEEERLIWEEFTQIM